jgi:hypothetical protein
MREPKEEAGNGQVAVDHCATTDWVWMDPGDLQVDPEFRRHGPVQSRGELLVLDESIRVEGCRDPLHGWRPRVFK